MAPTRKPATEEKRVLLRFDPETYNAVSAAATLAGKSFNAVVMETLHNAYCSTAINTVSMLDATRQFYGNALIASSSSNPGNTTWIQHPAGSSVTYTFSQTVSENENIARSQK